MCQATLSNRKVYAVVTTYNGAPWIDSCLRSLLSSQYPLTIIVVDNGSTDETLSIVNGYAQVLLLQQQKNIGFGRANNIGISTALEGGADFVFLLNQDAYIHPETIGTLVNHAQYNPEFGILSPFHLNGTGTKIDVNFIYYLLDGASDFFSDLYFGRLKDIYSVQFVNAAVWLITRRCLEQVGGFDPLFFMYGEDNDYCNRVAFHGFKIGVVPSALAFHYRGQPPNALSRWQRIQKRTNRLTSSILVTLKHPAKPIFKQILFVGVDILHHGTEFILRVDRQGIVALVIAVLKIILLMPQILKHRAMSQRIGPHWIA